MPRISTSLTAAFTMGMLTVGGPNPTSTKTPPDFVAYMRDKRKAFSRVSFYHKGTGVIHGSTLCVYRCMIVNLHSCFKADVINKSSYSIWVHSFSSKPQVGSNELSERESPDGKERDSEKSKGAHLNGNKGIPGLIGSILRYSNM